MHRCWQVNCVRHVIISTSPVKHEKKNQYHWKTLSQDYPKTMPTTSCQIHHDICSPKFMIANQVVGVLSKIVDDSYQMILLKHVFKQ